MITLYDAGYFVVGYIIGALDDPSDIILNEWTVIDIVVHHLGVGIGCGLEDTLWAE